MSSPSPLWYASRGLGLVLLVVLTASVVLGVLASQRRRSAGWPLFVTSGLHRNLSLLAVALLVLHGLGVLLDPYARLGLTDVTIPFSSAYRSLWLGSGVLGGELLVALVAVSLLRRHVGWQVWRATHWAAYVAWPLALLHGLGTGSDSRAPWALLLYLGCLLAVVAAVIARLSLDSSEAGLGRFAASALTVAGAVGMVIWAAAGPLQPGWALVAGTPRDLLAGAEGSQGGGVAGAPGAPGQGSGSAGQDGGGGAGQGGGGAQGVPAGLNDEIRGRWHHSDEGTRYSLEDVQRRSLRLTVVTHDGDGTGTVELRDDGQVLCQADADVGEDVTATCGSRQVDIALPDDDDGGHPGMLRTSG